MLSNVFNEDIVMFMFRGKMGSFLSYLLRNFFKVRNTLLGHFIKQKFTQIILHLMRF
jgi:hypothetical protein